MSQKRHLEDGRGHRSDGNAPEAKRRKAPAFTKYELLLSFFKKL